MVLDQIQVFFCFSGVYLGTIICLPITGIISKSSFGWPVTFYLIGGCGILWSAAWLCFGHNSPASHPSITAEERRYIEVSLNQENDAQVKYSLSQNVTINTINTYPSNF